MTFTFRPAAREKTGLLIGVAGPSSSGKTFSALRMATGLAQGGKIAAIDTESRRMLHYADQFDFQYVDMDAPFSPDRYSEALKAAAAIDPAVIIVDSMSHEHEGPGGILEMHDAELERMAGNDFRKRERVKFSAWIKPKRQHNAFVNAVLQMNTHVIFCFRAKDKLAMVKNAQGKQEPVSIGWQPICSDRFQYEMTALLMLPPNGQGVPDLEAQAMKVQAQHAHMFPAGQQISEDMGRQLAAWAGGETVEAPKSAALESAKREARKGSDAFRQWWNTPEAKTHRAELKPHLPALQKIASVVDARPAEDEDPFAGAEKPAQSDLADGDKSSGEPDLLTQPPQDGGGGGKEPDWAALVSDLTEYLDGANTIDELEVRFQSERVGSAMVEMPEQQCNAIIRYMDERRGELV